MREADGTGLGPEDNQDHPATSAIFQRLTIELPWVAQHCARVGALAMEFARSLGFPERECLLLYNAGVLHDCGKLGCSADLVSKPSELTAHEMGVLREHALLSSSFVLDADPSMQRVAVLVAQHHERCDGKGYPYGLTIDAVDALQPILVLADAYDSITHVRPYRPAAHPTQAYVEILSHTGPQFSEAFAKPFIEFLRDRNARRARKPNAAAAARRRHRQSASS